MTRAEPPFEPATRTRRAPTEAEMLANARRVAANWHHDDPLRSLADLHDALNPPDHTKG